MKELEQPEVVPECDACDTPEGDARWIRPVYIGLLDLWEQWSLCRACMQRIIDNRIVTAEMIVPDPEREAASTALQWTEEKHTNTSRRRGRVGFDDPTGEDVCPEVRIPPNSILQGG